MQCNQVIMVAMSNTAFHFIDDHSLEAYILSCNSKLYNKRNLFIGEPHEPT